MATITHRNDTTATVETKKDKYEVTISYSGEKKIIAIEKTNIGIGICAERMRLKVPDWKIIKPLVEEALREDEIARRIFKIMKGNNV